MPVKRGEVLRLTADPADLHIFDASGSSFAARAPDAQAAA
jgi:hypothetical protein